jgi:hypothetical protein
VLFGVSVDAPLISRGCSKCHQQNSEKDQRSDDMNTTFYYVVGNYHPYQNVEQHKKLDTARNGSCVLALQGFCQFWCHYQ